MKKTKEITNSLLSLKHECKKYKETINDGSEEANDRVSILQNIITGLDKIAPKEDVGNLQVKESDIVDLKSQNPFLQIYTKLEKIITDCNVYAEDSNSKERDCLHKIADDCFPLLLIAADHARDKNGGCSSDGCGSCSGC